MKPSETFDLPETYARIMALSAVQAKATKPIPYRSPDTQKLAERVLEDLTAVSASWLGPVAPVIQNLLAKAQNENLSEADLVRACEACDAAMPELFAALDWRSLAAAIEKAQGTAALNGAVARQMEAARVHH